jgi:hypothetical protein
VFGDSSDDDCEILEEYLMSKKVNTPPKKKSMFDDSSDDDDSCLKPSPFAKADKKPTDGPKDNVTIKQDEANRLDMSNAVHDNVPFPEEQDDAGSNPDNNPPDLPDNVYVNENDEDSDESLDDTASYQDDSDDENSPSQRSQTHKSKGRNR